MGTRTKHSLKTSETKKSHHHEHFPCLSVARLISQQSARSLWSLWRRIHQSSAQEEHRRVCLHQPQVLHTPGCSQGCWSGGHPRLRGSLHSLRLLTVLSKRFLQMLSML